MVGCIGPVEAEILVRRGVDLCGVVATHDLPDILLAEVESVLDAGVKVAYHLLQSQLLILAAPLLERHLQHL